MFRQLAHLDFEGGENQTPEEIALRASFESSLIQLSAKLAPSSAGIDAPVSDPNRTPKSSPQKQHLDPVSADAGAPIQFVPLIENLDGSGELNSVRRNVFDEPGVIGIPVLQPTNLSDRLGHDAQGDAAESDASSGNGFGNGLPAVDEDGAVASDEGSESDHSDVLQDNDEEKEKQQEEEEKVKEEEEEEERIRSSKNKKKRSSKNKKKRSSAKKKAQKKRDRSTGGGSGDDDDVGRLKDSEGAKRLQTRQGESQGEAQVQVSASAVQDQHVDDEVVSNGGREADAIDSSEKADEPDKKRDRSAPEVDPSMVASAPPVVDGRSLVVDGVEQGPSLSLALVEEGGASKKQKKPKQKKQKSGLSLEKDFVPVLEKMKQSADANMASLAEEKDLLTVKMPMLEKQDGAELVKDPAKLAMVYNSAAGGKRSAKETLTFLVVWWALCERALLIADIFEHLGKSGNFEAGWKSLPDSIGGKKKVAYNSAFPYRSLGEFIRKYPRFLFQTELIKMADWQVTYSMGDENQNTVRVLEQILAKDAEERAYWSSAPAAGVVFASATALEPSSN